MKKLIFPFFILILVGIIVAHENKPKPAISVLGKAPNFTLERSDGTNFNSNSLNGVIWLAHFFFTSCQGPCPVTTVNIKILQDRFLSSDNFKIISITMDPETDNNLVLNNFAKKHHIDLSRWSLLRGDLVVTKDLLDNGFSVGSHDDLHFHTTRTVLVDRLGNIRGYYQATEKSSIDKLERDIRQLLHEADSDIVMTKNHVE